MKRREKTNLKATLSVLTAVTGFIVALMSALQLQGRVRMVDIVSLFFGGAAAGVGLVGAIVEHRCARERERQGSSGETPGNGRT